MFNSLYTDLYLGMRNWLIFEGMSYFLFVVRKYNSTVSSRVSHGFPSINGNIQMTKLITLSATLLDIFDADRNY